MPPVGPRSNEQLEDTRNVQTIKLFILNIRGRAYADEQQASV